MLLYYFVSREIVFAFQVLLIMAEISRQRSVDLAAVSKSSLDSQNIKMSSSNYVNNVLETKGDSLRQQDASTLKPKGSQSQTFDESNLERGKTGSVQITRVVSRDPNSRGSRHEDQDSIEDSDDPMSDLSLTPGSDGYISAKDSAETFLLDNDSKVEGSILESQQNARKSCAQNVHNVTCVVDDATKPETQSRFRVVKVDSHVPTIKKKGRWTCKSFHEQTAMEKYEKTAEDALVGASLSGSQLAVDHKEEEQYRNTISYFDTTRPPECFLSTTHAKATTLSQPMPLGNDIVSSSLTTANCIVNSNAINSFVSSDASNVFVPNVSTFASKMVVAATNGIASHIENVTHDNHHQINSNIVKSVNTNVQVNNTVGSNVNSSASVGLTANETSKISQKFSQTSNKVSEEKKQLVHSNTEKLESSVLSSHANNILQAKQASIEEQGKLSPPHSLINTSCAALNQLANMHVLGDSHYNENKPVVPVNNNLAPTSSQLPSSNHLVQHASSLSSESALNVEPSSSASRETFDKNDKSSEHLTFQRTSQLTLSGTVAQVINESDKTANHLVHSNVNANSISLDAINTQSNTSNVITPGGHASEARNVHVLYTNDNINITGLASVDISEAANAKESDSVSSILLKGSLPTVPGFSGTLLVQTSYPLPIIPSASLASKSTRAEQADQSMRRYVEHLSQDSASSRSGRNFVTQGFLIHSGDLSGKSAVVASMHTQKLEDADSERKTGSTPVIGSTNVEAEIGNAAMVSQSGSSLSAVRYVIQVH